MAYFVWPDNNLERKHVTLYIIYVLVIVLVLRTRLSVADICLLCAIGFVAYHFYQNDLDDRTETKDEDEESFKDAISNVMTATTADANDPWPAAATTSTPAGFVPKSVDDVGHTTLLDIEGDDLTDALDELPDNELLSSQLEKFCSLVDVSTPAVREFMRLVAAFATTHATKGPHTREAVYDAYVILKSALNNMHSMDLLLDITEEEDVTDLRAITKKLETTLTTMFADIHLSSDLDPEAFVVSPTESASDAYALHWQVVA